MIRWGGILGATALCTAAGMGYIWLVSPPLYRVWWTWAATAILSGLLLVFLAGLPREENE